MTHSMAAIGKEGKDLGRIVGRPCGRPIIKYPFHLRGRHDPSPFSMIPYSHTLA